MTTEEKILTAARKVFKEKGFAATRTRDIAEEAGVNLALLNYYFKSKENLFNQVMTENFRNFFEGLRPYLNDDSKDFKGTIEAILNKVIDTYLDEPELLIFILNEVRFMPKKYFVDLNLGSIITGSKFWVKFREYFGLDEEGSVLKVIMFMMNMVSFVVFPFICEPVVESFLKVDNAEFREIVNRRRKMIPEWIDFSLSHTEI